MKSLRRRKEEGRIALEAAGWTDLTYEYSEAGGATRWLGSRAGGDRVWLVAAADGSEWRELAQDGGAWQAPKVERVSDLMFAPGEAHDHVETLPDWPSPSSLSRFLFYRPVDAQGAPKEWMRAKGPLDGKAGVYFIVDLEGDALYVGSSVGTSAQGNVRRTAAHHWQGWERAKGGGEAGVVLPRRDVAICFLLVPVDLEVPPGTVLLTAKGKPPVGQYALAPRQIESWYQRLVDAQGRLLGTARLISHDSPETPF